MVRGALKNDPLKKLKLIGEILKRLLNVFKTLIARQKLLYQIEDFVHNRIQTIHKNSIRKYMRIVSSLVYFIFS